MYLARARGFLDWLGRERAVSVQRLWTLLPAGPCG